MGSQAITVEPLSVDEAAEHAALFRVLGDPVRLRLLSLIASDLDGEIAVTDLLEQFELSGATISHHLRTLREAGLVESDRRGSWIYYRALPDRWRVLAGALS